MMNPTLRPRGIDRSAAGRSNLDRGRRLRRLLAGLAVVAFLAAGATPAMERGESPTIDLSPYDGHWRRIDDGRSDAERLSAIDRAIAGLSWIVRKMASGVLRKTTTPPPELEFVWDGERLYQGLQGKNRDTSKPVQLDGLLRSGEDVRGVPFSWSWSLTESGLKVHWEQHQANGSNLYRVDESDRSTLVVQHTINVTAISDVEPIVYLSRFSRTEDASGPPDDGSGPAEHASRKAGD